MEIIYEVLFMPTVTNMETEGKFGVIWYVINLR
jgi:hypothetical protein